MPTYFWFVWLLGMAVTTTIGAIVVRRWRDTYGWGVMVSLLAVYLLTNTVLAGRLVDLGTITLLGYDIRFVVLTGTVLWPFTLQLIDMVNEVYGERRAYITAAVAYLGRFAFLSVVVVGASMTPVWGADQEAFWQGYFTGTYRIVFAALVAYTTVKALNIYVFARFKRRTMPNEHTLWQKIKGGFLRTWGSDFIAQIVDSPVFYTLAFYGLMPNDVLLSLILGAFTTKVIINQVGIPYYAAFRVLLEWNFFGYVTEKVRKDY